MPDGAPEALPSRVTVLTGSVMVCALPASATGGRGAALTVMVTAEVEDSPLLLVTSNSNLYIPSKRLLTTVTALNGSMIVSPEGPDNLRHE